MSNYFDLHLHPSFKPFLSDLNPDNRKNCWEFIRSIVPIVRSQSSLDQIKEGGVSVAVAAIYAMERPMTSSFLIDHLLGPLTFLDDKVLHHPTYSNYFDQVKEEIKHLERSLDTDPAAGRDFQIVNSVEDLDENRTNIILALEGGHGLEDFRNNILENLESLKTGKYRFLYLTLVHMTQYPLTNHCYGMKLIKGNNQFKPNGFGLQPLGKQIIDLAYRDNSGEYRTYIDIKHMSLVARRQFYVYRKEKGYDQIPILATHMGLTGISWSNMAIAQLFNKRVIRKDGYIEVSYDRPPGIGSPRTGKTHFNPWSINLYDEEIIEIVQSDGLIGISMDQRILGAQSVDGEFFSETEFAYIISGYKEEYLPKDTWDQIAVEGEFVEESEEARDFNKRKHLRHICNQILHMVRIGGEKAWSHLCLGSDFDGLIDPVNNCTSVAEYPKLEEGLADMIPKMMEESEHSYDHSDIPKKVRAIMYDNALAFLAKYFK